MSQRILRWGSFVLSISLVFVSLVMTTACTTTPPNTKEMTPPQLIWSVLNDSTHTTTSYFGLSNPVIHTTQGTEYFIVFKANDPGGIKQITLATGSSWQCLSGDLGQNINADGPEQITNFSPDNQGNVSTNQFTDDQATIDFTCQSGFQLSSGSFEFDGTSTNYSNKVAMSSLSFTIP